MTQIATREIPRLWTGLALALLMAAGFFLRVHGMEIWYYNPDESLHLSMAEGKDLAETLRFSHYEAHPPLGNFLQHYWILFSKAPWFTRTLPLIFGLLTIPLYYAIGRLAAGELAGLCCAGLIAFSQGCIIQSYIMRHYMMFAFFVSLSFYFYLRWRESRGTGALFGYGVFAMLACLTHFSGIFDVVCIGAFESLGLLRRKALRPLSLWLAVNAVVGLIALYVYYLWQPILLPLKSYFAGHTAGSTMSLLTHTLFYPLATPGYMLPGYMAALIVLLAEIGVAVTTVPFIANPSGLRSVLKLSALAYGFGMLLVLTRIYPEPGTRHSSWILPFVILPAGWILADAARWLARKIPPYETSLPIIGSLLLLLGIVTYSAKDRFSDSSEYVWTVPQWKSFDDYMQTLGPRDLIITEKDDGIMLANLYPGMDNSAFSGKEMAALTAYGSKHILFNPYFPRNYSTAVFLSTLEQAKEKHMLDGIDNFVFLQMTWSRSPSMELMLCPDLEKKILMFPPGHQTRDGFSVARADVMLLSKKVLFEDVLPENGKARHCFNEKHDMAPSLAPPVP